MKMENGEPEARDRPAVNAPQVPEACPATGKERLTSVDTLRGVAVLGILAMNIYAYSLPYMAYENPSVMGGFDGLNRLTWWITHMFFSFKMMPIFSMLFGAGLMLMHERFTPRGISFRKLWYRRILWLMVMGAVHGYLLWAGDILFLYSVCGLFLYLFRKKSAKRLIVAASIFYVIAFLPNLAAGYYFGMIRDEMLPRIESKLEAGEELTAEEQAHRKQWDETKKHFNPSREDVERDIEVMRGGYPGIVKYRAPLYFAVSTYMLAFGGFWPTIGLMLLGMAFVKMGVFSASRSKMFYLILCVIGYGAGLPVAYLSARGAIASDFSFVESFMIRGPLNLFGGPLVALGHVGMIMLVCRSGILSGLRRRLADAGRMALSNYIGQTLICTTIFYGYGLGLYASFDRSALMLFVAGVWAVELIVSPLWLGRFRFGPLEWLWRTLTYGKRQPMRKDAPVLTGKSAGG
jgi:uncharacterized protein